jgi:transketolase
VLTGEGDLNEGQSWEAVLAAAKFRPERLVLLVDYNKVQLDGPSESIMPLDPLPEKFLAFRWNVAPRTYDGNDAAQVLASFDWIREQRDWPVVVIYRTRKGRGVSFMQDQAYWHGAPIDDASYRLGRTELLATLAQLEAGL